MYTCILYCTPNRPVEVMAVCEFMLRGINCNLTNAALGIGVPLGQHSDTFWIRSGKDIHWERCATLCRRSSAANTWIKNEQSFHLTRCCLQISNIRIYIKTHGRNHYFTCSTSAPNFSKKTSYVFPGRPLFRVRRSAMIPGSPWSAILILSSIIGFWSADASKDSEV